jgi:hypothetical protein
MAIRLPDVGHFPFVRNADLRRALNADFQELQTAIKYGAWRAAHVLAGSIIEAILVDVLIYVDHHARTQKDPQKMALSELTAACRAEGIISEKAQNILAAVKDYRNLIHPGRALRLGESVNADSANVASTLVSLIAREIDENLRRKHGYTAEQILKKIESDHSSVRLIRHLFREMNRNEVHRLMLEIIPDRYLSLEDSAEYDESQEAWSKTRSILSQCHRACLTFLGEDARKQAAQNFVRLLKTESTTTIEEYEDAFFHAVDLEWLGEADRELVKEHIILRLEKQASPKFLLNMGALLPFLSYEEANRCLLPVLACLINDDSALATSAKNFLERSHQLTSRDIQKCIEDRAAELLKKMIQSNREDAVERLRDVVILGLFV